MQKEFLVLTNEYQGPFDKVLDLIESKKMSINDISLSKITDEYISFLKENEFKLEDTSKFIWVASILIFLKSKSLLPKINFQEENQDINELKGKLEVLNIFRTAGKELKERWFKKRLYKKKFIKRKEISFKPDKKINFKNILLSLDILIQNQKKEENTIPEKKVLKQKSLKEITEEIIQKIERYIKLSFNELVLTSDKKEVSASFISILELYRNDFIDLKQDEDFGNIMIERRGSGDVFYKE